MNARQTWLDTLWPNVLVSLPPPPAVVVELGCGRHGGFVPALLEDGYQPLGIDPDAPEGERYQRSEFEQSSLPPTVHAIVACTSLHHVGDPGAVIDRMAAALVPGGVVVIVEWDWKSFDEATANWCFERLGDQASDEHDGWLEHQRRHWIESGQPWERYVRGWVDREGIHPADLLLAELDSRFDRLSCARGPYFFPDLVKTTEEDELRAIGEGLIKATRIDYVGRLPS